MKLAAECVAGRLIESIAYTGEVIAVVVVVVTPAIGRRRCLRRA